MDSSSRSSYCRDIGCKGFVGHDVCMWIPVPLLRKVSAPLFGKRITDLTECPKGHERTITCDARTPKQEWLLTCPLCGSEHTIVAPQILRSDLS